MNTDEINIDVITDISALRQRDLAFEKLIVQSPRGVTFKLRGPSASYALKWSVGDAADHDHPIRREIDILRDLSALPDHLYVDHGVHEKHHWLLLNWIEGKHAASVGKVIRQQESTDDISKVFATLFTKLALKTFELHERGYVHGDLQPSHFIQDSSGTIHLIDFGLAKQLTDSSKHYRGGLVHYDPPETALAILNHAKELPLDFLTDQYSFGSSLYFIYTGATSTDYGTEDYRQLSMQQKLSSIAYGTRRSFKSTRATAFPELEAIIDRCMHKDRRSRYDNLNEVASAFRQLI